MMGSTLVFVIATIVTYADIGGENDVDVVVTRASLYFLMAVIVSLALEVQAGIRNLIRVDIFMLLVLFILTFFEFTLPQETLSGTISAVEGRAAVMAVALGFCGLSIGRHVFPPIRNASIPLSSVALSPRVTIRILLGATFLAYLYMLVAVNFNVFEVFSQLLQPRFTQAWSRDRYGSVATLLNEVGLLSYLLPPMCASVFAQYKRFNFRQLSVAGAILMFVMFEGLAGGTRSVLLVHMATFAATYVATAEGMTFKRATIIAGIIGFVSYIAVQVMLDVRTVGIQGASLQPRAGGALFVDMNIVNIANLTTVFPGRAQFLGFEVPWIAVVRPIPRALWSGKPEGLSLSIEDALGVGSHMTLSATFVGELWMAGGDTAVLLGGLLLGALAGWWNRRGASARSQLEFVLFASAFFPAGIAMRSILSAAPPLLPVFALSLLVRYLNRRR